MFNTWEKKKPIQSLSQALKSRNTVSVSADSLWYRKYVSSIPGKYQQAYTSKFNTIFTIHINII